MANIKDIGAIAAKYAQRAGAASGDYKSGVTTPRNDWAANTQAAATTWKDAVSQVPAERFARGVAKTGTPGWQEKATTLGAARYSQGVAAGQRDYAEGFAPFADTIKGLTLPPRAPKGSPQNVQRVQAIADALHRKKTGG